MKKPCSGIMVDVIDKNGELFYKGTDIATKEKTFIVSTGKSTKETTLYLGLFHAILSVLSDFNGQVVYTTDKDTLNRLNAKKTAKTNNLKWDSEKVKDMMQRLTPKIEEMDFAWYGSDEIIVNATMSVKLWDKNIWGELNNNSKI